MCCEGMYSNIWILLPPVAFMVIFGVVWVLSVVVKPLAAPRTPNEPGKGQPYCCGEHDFNHRLRPDYSAFFPFAFFFTIMHVIALIVATMPQSAFRATGVAVLYVVVGLTGLLILFRKK